MSKSITQTLIFVIPLRYQQLFSFSHPLFIFSNGETDQDHVVSYRVVAYVRGCLDRCSYDEIIRTVLGSHLSRFGPKLIL